MNVIKEFTKRNMSRNRKRTIVTIIGVMLSTALICTVAGMVATFRHSIIEDYKEKEGDYHLCYGIDGNIKQYEIATNQAHAEKTGVIQTLGFSTIDLEDVRKDYLCIYGLGDGVEDQMRFTMKEGRFPENNREIVLSADYIRAGGQEKIGDKITLNLGRRTDVEDHSVNLGNSYFSDVETWEPGKDVEYEVVGIIDDKYSFVGYNGAGFGCFTREPEYQGGYVQVFIRLDQPTEFSQIQSTINSALEHADVVDTPFDWSTNTLVRYEGGFSETATKMVFALGGVICLIIVGTSIFVISNSFRISVEDKKVQFGMLASIGATKRQIRNIVLREAGYIFLIGTTAGMALGALVIWILDCIVNFLLRDMLIMKMLYTLPWWVVVFTIALSGVTIFFASLIPAKMATRITPIEIIRGGSDIRIDENALKSRALTRKMFGVGGTIAEKNIRRNRKKYRAAIVSLTIGVATFIGVSSFVGYGRKLVGEVYADVDYNITVNPVGEMTEENMKETTQIYDRIRSMSGIKDSCYFMDSNGEIDVETVGTEKTQGEYAELNYRETINFVILKKNDFRKYMARLGVTEEPSGVAFLADRAIYYNADGVKTEGRNLTVQDGDTITVYIPESERVLTQEELESGEGDIYNYTEKEVKITRVVGEDELPVGVGVGFKQYGGLVLIVSEDYFDKLPVDAFLRTLFIDAEDPIEFQKGIDAIAGTGNDTVRIYNAEHERQSNSRMILVLEIFLYGFIIVIVLIGVTNVVNTINTSMKMRSREFAMLRSVGMTKKDFRRMIRAEGILYSLKSVIFGIPIGLMLCGLVYLAVRRQFDYGIIIPWFSIVIAVAGVALIVGIIMWNSVRRVRKQNIIDTIRMRNY